VVAVDDHRPFLKVVREIIGMTSRLDLVGEADGAERAEELCHLTKPDMVVMDVHMAQGGGIAAGRRVKASLPDTLLVLMSTTPPDELPREAREVADLVLWKSDLSPSVLEQLWMDHNGK
jgi:DNA-binding NarL/FixJ family response regulator